MRPIGLAVLALAVAACGPRREPVSTRELPPLIPLPASFTYGEGSWKADFSAPGYTWTSPAGTPLIDLASAVQVTTRIEAGKPESYRLDITPSGAEIVGGDAAGLFYGQLTLRQLVAAANGGAIRSIHIEDAPRFRWRGMHLDVGAPLHARRSS